MSKPLKTAIWCVAIVMVCLTIYLFVCSTNYILGKSYKTEDLIPQNSVETIGFEDKIQYSNPDDEISTATNLYSPNNIEDRQKAYLGSEYEKWNSVIETAKGEYEEVFSELGNVSSIEMCQESYIGDISESSLSSVNHVRLDESTSIIGMYDSNIFMLSYRRMLGGKPCLIVADTTNYLFNTKRSALYSFGDTIPLYLESGCFRVHDSESYTILYVKC